MYSSGPPHMAKQKLDDQFEHTYSSYVRIRDISLKTCQKRWMIGRSGERWSGISMLAARHDDDDESAKKEVESHTVGTVKIDRYNDIGSHMVNFRTL